MADKSPEIKKRDHSAENQATSTSVDCPFSRQATEAFLIFDASNNETVDVREIGTIIRSLGKSGFPPPDHFLSLHFETRPILK